MMLHDIGGCLLNLNAVVKDKIFFMYHKSVSITRRTKNDHYLQLVPIKVNSSIVYVASIL